MSAPKRLSVAERRLWEQVERELKRRGQWRPVLGQLLEPMVANWVIGDELLTKARERPLTRGSQGQDVRNPLFGQATQCQRLALSYAQALGLSIKNGVIGPAASSAPAESEPQKDPGSALDELARRRSQVG